LARTGSHHLFEGVERKNLKYISNITTLFQFFYFIFHIKAIWLYQKISFKIIIIIIIVIINNNNNISIIIMIYLFRSLKFYLKV